MIKDDTGKNNQDARHDANKENVSPKKRYIDSSNHLHAEIVKLIKEFEKKLDPKERIKFQRQISEGLFSLERKKGQRDDLVKKSEKGILSLSFNTSKLSKEESKSLEEAALRIQESVNKGIMPKLVFADDLFAPVIYEYPKNHVFYDERKSYVPMDANDPDLASMTAYEFYEHQYGYLRDKYLLSKSQFIEDEPKLYKAILQYCSRNPNIDKNNVLPHTESEIKRFLIGKEFIEEASKLSFSEYQQKHRRKNSLSSEP